MTTHEQTRELINEIKTLIEHAENGTLDYSALEHARKLVFHIDAKFDEVKELLQDVAEWEYDYSSTLHRLRAKELLKSL